MFICWNVGGLLMEVHLQLHCFYIKFAIVNELPQKTNALTIVKKTSIYYTLLITQRCWKITYGKVIVNRLYHILCTTVHNSWKAYTTPC